MAGPKYPLEQLATIKQKKLEEAEKVLKAKKEALIKEQEKLKAVEKERDKVKEHRDAKLEQFRQQLDLGGSSTKIQQMKQYLKLVEEQLKAKEIKVKEQMKQVDAAQAQVDAARADFLKKQQDVEKLRLHKEDWDKEMQKLAQHQEGVETDELGSAMHVRKKRKKDD